MPATRAHSPNTVGGETLERSWGVLKKGGILVSLVEKPSQQRAALGVRALFFIVRPNRAQLIRIGQLINAGHVRPVVESILPLAQARQAYAARPRSGKTVLQVFNEDTLVNTIAEEERQARESYRELGRTGEHSQAQSYREAIASGEVSRELREMRHGEFGPKAYEWLAEE